jgi:transcriptional regulator with XRE-family HTH domain
MKSTPINSTRDFAALVRGRRHELDLTQVELAERMEVSRQWVALFEAGNRGAGLDRVIRLLDALELRLVVDEAGKGGGGEREGDGPPTEDIDLDALLDRHRKP